MHVCHCEEGALRRVEKGVKRKGPGGGGAGEKGSGERTNRFHPGKGRN